MNREAIERSLRSFADPSYVHGAPRCLKFSRCNNRLYYLDGHEGKLCFVQLPIASDAAPAVKVLDNIKVPRPAAMSLEEELLRERLRNTLTGISNFLIAEAAQKIFLYSGPNVFLASLDGDDVRDIAAELRASCGTALDLSGAWMDIKHHPDDPFLMSFVRNNNLYVARIDATSGGVVRAVTTVGNAIKTCAVADYIMQEEFSQYSAQFWSPAADPALLFTVTDLSRQRHVKLHGKNDSVQEIPFPRVGDPNATASLVIATQVLADTPAQYGLLPASVIASRFPWVEYITRLKWRDENTVYAVMLSREQERCVHVEIPRAAFTAVAETAFFAEAVETIDAAAVAAQIRVVRDVSIPWAWTETTNDLHLGDTFDVIGANDTTSDGGAADASSAKALYQAFRRDHGSSTWERLTSGESVKWDSISVHTESKSLFYAIYHARGVSLHRADLDTKVTEQLTPPDHHVHSFAAFPDGSAVAYIGSSLTTQPGLYIVPASRSSSAQTAAPSPVLMAPPANPVSPVVPHLATYRNRRGHDVPLSLYVPQSTAPADGWPLMVYVYGGPHVQLVNHGFGARCDRSISVLVSNGIAVAVVDTQQAVSLGLRAHAVCKYNMGRFEADDCRDALAELLGGKHGGDGVKFNPARVGMFGWSYGGYTTLMCMAQASDAFKLGLAVAPVGDWLLYDTGYTERYMGLLPERQQSYDAGRVTAYTKGFPSELNRVFIAHGTLDENVHFTNTTAVIESMIEHGKPYSLLIYPGERHGLRQNPASRMHWDITMLQIITTHL